MSFLRRTARVAVASSVHGRVQRRQHQRWAAEDQASGAAGAPSSDSGAARPADAEHATAEQTMAQLASLGELHRSGVLTDAEFGDRKAVLLARLSS